jgi:cbb3-type cytochrome oxidase subunit 1
MTHVGEINILKEKDVKITNERAIIGTKTYAISEVTSVSMDVNEPKLFLPIFFIVIAGVCSVLIALSDMREYSEFLTTSLYLGIAGLLFFIFSQKTKYSVRIRSASGELKVLETFDKEHVERIVKALNEAIVQRE